MPSCLRKEAGITTRPFSLTRMRVFDFMSFICQLARLVRLAGRPSLRCFQFPNPDVAATHNRLASNCGLSAVLLLLNRALGRARSGMTPEWRDNRLAGNVQLPNPGSPRHDTPRFCVA